MKFGTFEKLEKLYKKFGPQEFGKICQKLLALSFQKAGFKYVGESERGVQGVDIGEAVRGEEKYSIEVKTTTKNIIRYEQKDAEGLLHQKNMGYQPVLAVLKLEIFSDWFFIKADKLKPGNIFIESLRVYRLRDLENEINPLFDETVEEHFVLTLEEGQKYLDNVLRKNFFEN